MAGGSHSVGELKLQRVKVQDFQSLADVDIELGRLSVIVGRSNAGKSAFVRAVEAALFNRAGGDFVRQGAKAAVVRLQFGDTWLTWEKPAKGGATYSMDRQVMTRVGREMAMIEELTGVREIQAEGVRARLAFAGQFEEPMLLAGTSGQAAKLLARVSKLDVLVTAQVLARRDMDRARRSAGDAEERAQVLRDRLTAMPDYGALLKRWQGVSEGLAVIQAEEEALVSAQAYVQQVRQLEKVQAVWQERQLPARSAAVGVEVVQLGEAASLVAAVADADRTRSQLVERAGVARERLVLVEQELHELLGTLDVCPVCLRPM